MNTPALRSRVDHLVVVAHTLAQGVAWCEAEWGVSPGPGGRHPLMGTHNRLVRIGGPAWPEAYLEIIAIDPEADAPPAAGRARWFGMDEPALRAAVREAPRLVHWVAQTPDIRRSCTALAALGENVGVPVAASRATPEGELRWLISLRDDGAPQHAGALPALIEWSGTHPSAAMADAGLRLERLVLSSPRREALDAALGVMGVEAVETQTFSHREPDPIEAWLRTPHGTVCLRSSPWHG